VGQSVLFEYFQREQGSAWGQMQELGQERALESVLGLVVQLHQQSHTILVSVAILASPMHQSRVSFGRLRLNLQYLHHLRIHTRPADSFLGQL